MKRIKYTNTKISPLEIKSLKGIKPHKTIYNDGKFVASLYRVRNHSKNESAKCICFFNNQQCLFNYNCDSLITMISNSYLYWTLFYKNTNLMKKLFKDGTSGSPKVIDEYIKELVKLKNEDEEQ